MALSAWRAAAPLLLASTSPTRRMLLESAGLPVETEAPDINERGLKKAEPAALRELARRLASEKALAVSRRRPGRIVVGADQVLELAGEALHKPEDRRSAERQLARLAGHTHELHSAFTIAQNGSIYHEGAATARLTMRRLDDAAIRSYLGLASEAATRNVGAYQLEGVGIHLFEHVEGDHSTILGLPLLPLLAALRAMKLLAL